LAQDRLPPIPAERLTAEQRAAAEAFAATRKAQVFGPFVPLLRSPELMTAASRMGEHLRYRSSLPARLSELAILLTARQWDQPVEWEIHQPAALAAGLSAAVVEAIGERRPPAAMADDEAAVFDFVTELYREKQVNDDTYDRILKLFGETGVIDLTGICGYYSLLAMTMNVARTPTSGGAGPRLP
jgi:4-carboxymuconolactone decarboxylase